MADSSSTSSFEPVHGTHEMADARPDHPGDAPTFVAPAPPVKQSDRREDPHPHRIPWALIASLAILAGVEIGVRRIDPSWLIVTRSDADQARAVRDEISLDRRVDVAFVGSSMTYQGINTPDLGSRLSDAIGRDVRVRNFAIRGGRMDVFLETVRHLLRQENRPELIVVGVSIRDLREYDLDFERMSIFWSTTDLVSVVADRGNGATKYLPTVIRNELEPHLGLLKYRNGLSTRLEQMLIDIRTEPMPARGEPPPQHIGSRQSTVLTLDEFKSRSNKRRMAQAYRIDLGPRPVPMLVECVDKIIESCSQAGVKLVFLDMPISEPMQGLIINSDKRRKSDQIEPAYRATMVERCKAGDVPFLTSRDLGLEWRLEDFYDSQHLNYAGATKLGNALAPALAGELAKAR